MLANLLNQLGMSSKETRIYLAINRHGPCGVSRLAAATALPRQTIYSIIQDLTKSGFVQQGDRRGVKQFFVDPQRLPLLLDEKKKELDKQKVLVEKALPELLAEQRRPTPLPKVAYYESESGLKTLFSQILQQYRSPKTERLFRGFGINQIQSTTIGDFLREFISERAAQGVTTKLLIGEGQNDFGITDKASRLGREVKHLPMPAQQAGAYLVGDRIYLFSYADNVGVMIENQAIAKLLKDVFDAYWEREKKPEQST